MQLYKDDERQILVNSKTLTEFKEVSYEAERGRSIKKNKDGSSTVHYKKTVDLERIQKTMEKVSQAKKTTNIISLSLNDYKNKLLEKNNTKTNYRY